MQRKTNHFSAFGACDNVLSAVRFGVCRCGSLFKPVLGRRKYIGHYQKRNSNEHPEQIDRRYYWRFQLELYLQRQDHRPSLLVNWGLGMVSPTKRLQITGRYDRNPQTMGAFANGYPQRTLEQFKDLHPDIQGIENLTAAEYAYATQLAIWATCGQLAVADTSFTSGRATLVKPTSDAQKIRVYESVTEILRLAQSWTKQLYTGLYFHMEKDRLGSSLNIYSETGLEGAAASGEAGIKKEVINGKEYYTRLMYIDSATSTFPNDYMILVYTMDAPSGTIFVDTSNQVFPTREQWGGYHV